MDQQCDENTESARVSVLLRFLVVFVCLFVLFIFNSRHNNTITFYRFPFLREGGKRNGSSRSGTDHGTLFNVE